jgi:3'-phosphoadenosine 5'-phosphosulfate sulfotransferase (PAPS reductase)/FAD synthetase
MKEKYVHVLSFGGGTPSSASLLMALKGEVNDVISDYIIFSDTGWDPQHVYDR